MFNGTGKTGGRNRVPYASVAETTSGVGVLLDWEAVRRRANDDGEFRLHGRFWTSRIRLGFGAANMKVEVRGGMVESIEPWFGTMAANLSIKAPEADWRALLARTPRPFYQDLYPATLHHGFDLSGDRTHCCAYYPALRRFVEIMREVHNGQV